MSPEVDLRALSRFLVCAKRETYAAQGDEASVPALLSGSKQLEFSDGRWHYRDVYFGTRCFAGLEVVNLVRSPVWSMSYAGGILPSGYAHRVAARLVYRFLRKALREVSEDSPFRGPRSLVENGYAYHNRWNGSIEAFSGEETISRGGVPIYRLRFAGGRLD